MNISAVRFMCFLYIAKAVLSTGGRHCFVDFMFRKFKKYSYIN